jgi:hypothetical protein
MIDTYSLIARRHQHPHLREAGTLLAVAIAMAALAIIVIGFLEAVLPVLESGLS